MANKSKRSFTWLAIVLGLAMLTACGAGRPCDCPKFSLNTPVVFR